MLSGCSTAWLIADAAVAALGKITLRAALAALVSFLLAVLLGPRLIAWLRRHFREPIKSDSPEVCRLHQGKQATPTMGGLFIVAGLIGGTLLLSATWPTATCCWPCGWPAA